MWLKLWLESINVTRALKTSRPSKDTVTRNEDLQ